MGSAEIPTCDLVFCVDCWIVFLKEISWKKYTCHDFFKCLFPKYSEGSKMFCHTESKNPKTGKMILWATIFILGWGRAKGDYTYITSTRPLRFVYNLV